MEQLINEKTAIVLDLLEQIEAVNKMIHLHTDDLFMKEQYIARKNEFIKKLVAQLGKFDIELKDLAA